MPGQEKFIRYTRIRIEMRMVDPTGKWCVIIYGLAKGCKLDISIKSLVLSPLPVHWGFSKPKTQRLNGSAAVKRTPGHCRLTENHQKFLGMASGGSSV